jgi:serine/threonine protein kinase
MAEVFRAFAQGVEGFARIFVVKRIHQDKSDDPQLIEMFINEARISALLNHPNIVQIYDFGEIDGWYFLAMEHLRGKDLLLLLRQLRLARRIMPAPMAAFIAREVAAGLAYAHRLTGPGGHGLQIVHRDVSPSNVMLLRAGGVKLLDFGIAKAEALLCRKTDSRTETMTVKGKLSYLSPEQVRSEPIDARSDIFSLGVMFWECLTGKRLFYDKADYKTMSNVLERVVPPPSALRPEVPPAVDRVVLHALEQSREGRYQDAQGMADDLDLYLAETRFQPRLLPRFLDDLFGPDETLADSLPGVPSRLIADLPEAPVFSLTSGALPPVSGLASFSRPIGKSDGLLPASPPGDLALSTVSRGRALALGLAGALIIGAFAAGLVLSSPPPPPEVPTQPVSAGVMRPEPPPASPESQPGAGELARPAPPDAVSLHIESEPPGADVADVRGRLLGITPLTTRVPRGSTPVAFVLHKRGFQTVRHEMTPESNTAAMISLRVAPSGRRSSPPVPTPPPAKAPGEPPVSPP